MPPPPPSLTDGDSEPAAKKARTMLPAVTGTTRLPAAIVLDIEGTVAPISFVTEVLSYTH